MAVVRELSALLGAPEKEVDEAVPLQNKSLSDYFDIEREVVGRDIGEMEKVRGHFSINQTQAF